MTADYKFKGYAAFDKDCVKNKSFKEWEYEPKAFAEDDVDIKILYCGICASDIHTATSGWRDHNKDAYPIVVGHEIVGEAVRVGSKITHIKVGDLVGNGAQTDSCLECNPCKTDRPSYCDKGHVGTYGGKFYREGPGKGDRSQGGYSNYYRGPGQFMVKIPAGLDPAMAAPMLCGGITVYAPLVKYGAGTTAKDVGIVGIGGLGHFGLLFAKALGANVTAISHSESKRQDAEKMGASRFIATHSKGKDDNDFVKGNERTLDLIVATTNDTNMPIEGYIKLLRPGGYLILVGAPEENIPSFSPFSLLMSGVHIGGSLVGSPRQIQEMVDLAAKQNIQSWITKRSLKDVNEAVADMADGKARYRYVLVNEENGGKL